MPSADKGCIRGMGESGPPWVFGAPGRRVLLVSDVFPPCPCDEEAASVPREDVEACRERGKAADSCTGLLPPMPIEGIAIVDAAEKAARSPPPLLSLPFPLLLLFGPPSPLPPPFWKLKKVIEKMEDKRVAGRKMAPISDSDFIDWLSRLAAWARRRCWPAISRFSLVSFYAMTLYSWSKSA